MFRLHLRQPLTIDEKYTCTFQQSVYQSSILPLYWARRTLRQYEREAKLRRLLASESQSYACVCNRSTRRVASSQRKILVCSPAQLSPAATLQLNGGHHRRINRIVLIALSYNAVGDFFRTALSTSSWRKQRGVLSPNQLPIS